MNFPYAKCLIAECQRRFNSSPPTHDWPHTQRVLDLSMHMAKEEGADIEILFAAALLHDIAREEAAQSNKCHAELSAKRAVTILQNCGFPEEKVDAVIHCIRSHRFRDKCEPKTIEAKVLYDADKLDAIGAIGICRVYAYAGRNGQPLYSSAGENYILNNTKKSEVYSPVDEFRNKLSKIKDHIFTNAGKRIAEGRHAFTINFFNRMYEEIRGIK